MNHIWTVPIDHPAFAGHFPGNLILPGVILLDEALQIMTHAHGIALNNYEISQVKFLSPAKPGDELTIQHTAQPNGAIRFDIISGTRKIAGGAIAPKSTP